MIENYITEYFDVNVQKYIVKLTVVFFVKMYFNDLKETQENKCLKKSKWNQILLYNNMAYIVFKRYK